MKRSSSWRPPWACCTSSILRAWPCAGFLMLSRAASRVSSTGLNSCQKGASTSCCTGVSAQRALIVSKCP